MKGPLEIVRFRWGEQNHTRHCREIRDVVFLEEQSVPFHIENADNKEAVFFLAYVGGLPTGCARYRETGEGFKLERFAVLKEFRNLQVGKALLRELLKEVPIESTYLFAQEGAVRFYEQNGFQKVGAPFVTADITHFRMTAQL